MELLKRNLKNTRTHETEVEIKMLMDECIRLRNQLEQVIKSKDTFADPQELKIIEGKFKQKDQKIAMLNGLNGQMQHENSDLSHKLAVLGKQCADMDAKLKRAHTHDKKEKVLAKQLKEMEQVCHGLKRELVE